MPDEHRQLKSRLKEYEVDDVEEKFGSIEPEQLVAGS